MILRFLKNWTLPLAMIAGTLGYFFFARIPFLVPVKPCINSLVAFLTPTLIFAQLLLTFCKVELHELKPKVWHAWLLIFQTVSCLIVAVLLVYCPMEETYREVFEGAMVCLICPTATAAAVITGKLGGSASSLTTYTLLSNLLAAVAVPIVFPMVEPHTGITFVAAFLKILSKVFPLLLCPFFLAWFLRAFMPKIHHLLLGCRDAAFYLWAVALAIVSGQTVRSLINSDASVYVEVMIALAGLITCCIQFYLGKRIGGHYQERISGGQALGQKNTVLAIWMAYTYLNPLSSVGPGSYVLWQNIINSWQLWKKRKKENEIMNINS
ncbi:transporter [uncultured Bacteroides sp.]|uniref:transporter n=1 Tax=uncultured Bacteroides sp. TaxID=162156 RepID=UPI0025E9B4B9|nr:transporter [uncultured Bacteroides sp.]